MSQSSLDVGRCPAAYIRTHAIGGCPLFFGLVAWNTALAVWFLPIDLRGRLAVLTGSSPLSRLVLRGLVSKTFFGGMIPSATVTVNLRQAHPPVLPEVRFEIA